MLIRLAGIGQERTFNLPILKANGVVQMMEGLISGTPASKLFRMLQQANSSIDAFKLWDILSTEFPNISPAAFISIRKWRDASDATMFPDEQIDGLIVHYLKYAGYIC